MTNELIQLEMFPAKRRYNVTVTMVAAVTVEASGSIEAERIALEDVGISYDSNDVSISVIAVEPEDDYPSGTTFHADGRIELPEEEDEELKFVNHYTCPGCGHKWKDVWSCMCDDDCPNCGMRHISPTHSDDI